MSREFVTVVPGCTYLEAPRWHRDRLWFSDLYTHRVLSAREDGSDVRVEAELAGPPVGLGWLPDGRLLVVSAEDSRLLIRRADGTLEVLADLSAHTRGWLNELVVDSQGRSYLGHFGFDLFGGELIEPASLLRVDPDGTITTVATDLLFPNGSVITPDGVLLVGESFANRVTAFDVAEDGSLRNRRVWASFGEPVAERDLMRAIGEFAVAPDGCCLDVENALWVADFTHGRVLRVGAGGEILDEISPGTGVFACTLGGADGRTLFLCTAPDFDRTARTAERAGQVLSVRVEVPGIGWV
ncbi:SMP-30/gluconolactonase/LRE family protein [Nocardia stercoris]|uniref:Gluconolactonase n=1 Tax=Nocardia stercoris TaxID=2483361 RepID=A0A3M2L2X3_9NOCA|nr:SMP-30/gluconolactonase/LRE family protein [Nocardia stercoris]RMI28868.1 gluconolactonase [Nocardia stercoris]